MADWILALLLAVAPPGPMSTRESEAAGNARYAQIARDLEAVVSEAEPLYEGADGRKRTALTLMAIAWRESGFRADVDDGRARGEGVDVCLLQIRVGRGRTADGWSAADLIADRRKCFATGLRIARQSLAACHRSRPDERLAAYASGRCSAGQRDSREFSRRIGVLEKAAARLEPAP